MSYRIVKRIFGSNKQETVCDVDISHDILDFCFIPEFGYLFVLRNEHCISHLDINGNLSISWLGECGESGRRDGTGRYARMNYPSSICYMPDIKRAYVIEGGGINLRYIELDAPYLNSLLGIAVTNSLRKYVSKVSIEDVDTFCCANKYGQVFWTSDKLHRCFKYYNGDVKVVVGNGRCGYASSSNLLYSRLNHPSGVAIVGNKIYIADKGNHCIREVSKKGLTLFEGCPLDKETMNPSYLKSHKNIFYILDGNDVRYFSPSGPSRGIIHSADNIEGIGLHERDLLILERVNAKT